MNCTYQGPVSISVKTSYREISQSLKGSRSNVHMFVSLWNLTGTSVTGLPRCLPNSKSIGLFQIKISWLRDFTRSYNNTYYRISKRAQQRSYSSDKKNKKGGDEHNIRWHNFCRLFKTICNMEDLRNGIKMHIIKVLFPISVCGTVQLLNY